MLGGDRQTETAAGAVTFHRPVRAEKDARGRVVQV